MKRDLESILHDIAGAATTSARPVAIDRMQQRVRRRRTVAVAGTTVAGAGAAGAVAFAATNLMAPPTMTPTLRPAGTASAAVEPAETTEPAVPAPELEPVAGWEPGAAPCGEEFTLDPVDGPFVELTGQALHGSPDERNLFQTGGDEEWVYLSNGAGPDVPGEIVDYDGAPTHGIATYLVDQAGTVAAWSDPATPEREVTDEDGPQNPSGLYDAVDCRTGQPLAGEYRVFAVSAPGEEPQVTGDVGPLGEVTELAPLVFGVGQDLSGTWDVAAQWGPRAGDTLAEALARGPEPELDITIATDRLEVNTGGVTGPATITSRDGSLTGVVPQHLRAFLVDDDGTVVVGVVALGFPSARTVDFADGAEVEMYQWFGLEGYDQLESIDLPAGSTYDLYAWQVIEAAGADGVVEPRIALSDPVPVTLSPEGVRNAG